MILQLDIVISYNCGLFSLDYIVTYIQYYNVHIVYNLNKHNIFCMDNNRVSVLRQEMKLSYEDFGLQTNCKEKTI